MNYQQFKAAVKAEVFPDRESSRLTARIDGWIQNCLIEIQQKVPCLQSNHREYILQEATYYSCGATAFPIPAGGYVKSLRVQRTDNQCNYVDSVPMTEPVFRGILQNLQACRCSPPTGAPDYLYYGYEYDYGYYDFGDQDPELRIATSAIDLPCHARNRAFSLYEGNVWLWPVLQSDETAILKWSGVRKSWLDSTVIPWDDEQGNVDREIIQIVGSYVMAQHYVHDNCDPDKAAISDGQYRKKLAEMIVECVRKTTLPQPLRVQPTCATC